MDVSVLPEGCVSHILSLTSPRDVVRSSAVSKLFLSASESHTIWDKFLPSDAHHIISQSSFPHLQALSKKQVFSYLCSSHILFNAYTQSFGLDKRSGKKCYMLGARALGITWGDTPAYWNWKFETDSRFPEVAELLTVCWLEIKGKMHIEYLSPSTIYGVYFVFKLEDDQSSTFKNVPLKVHVRETDEDGATICNQHDILMKTFYLEPPNLEHEVRYFRHGELPDERSDGWMEIEMGRYQVGHSADNISRRIVLEMILTEVNVLNWKRGLLVQGIELRPLN